MPASLFHYSEPARSPVPRLVLAVVTTLFAAYYYVVIDRLVHRSRAAFEPPQSEGKDLCRVAGAAFRPVSITASDGVALQAWLMQPARPNGKAVVLLHNLYGTRLRMMPQAWWLLRHDFTCLLPDSRGHGASGGEVITLGIREKYDVAGWVDLLRSDAAITSVYGLGMSLGASTLIQSLSVPVDFRAIIADSTGADPAHPYEFLADRFNLPQAVIAPIAWPFVQLMMWNARLRHDVRLERASPLEALRSARVPVLLIQGTDDWLIPVGYARRLHAANPQYTELWEVRGGSHLRVADAAPDYEKRMIDWFKRH